MQAKNQTFYKNSIEHLHDELLWLNHIIFNYVSTARSANVIQKFNNFSGFYISDDEVDSILNQPDFLGSANIVTQDNGIAVPNRNLIEGKISASYDNGIYLSLNDLRLRFGLTYFEYAVFIICLAPQLDARYQKLYAYLQNDLSKKAPGIDLILDFLSGTPEERLHNIKFFHPSAPLQKFNLVEKVTIGYETVKVLGFLSVPQRLTFFVLENQFVEPNLEKVLRLHKPLSFDSIVVSDNLQTQLKDLIKELVPANGEKQLGTMFFLTGREGSGRKTITRAICSELNVLCGVVDLRALKRDPESFRDRIRLILREGILQPCIICFDNFETLQQTNDSDKFLLDILVQELREFGWITVACSQNPMPSELLDDLSVYPIELPFPNYNQQKELWYLNLKRELGDGDLPEIAMLPQRFTLSAGQIKRSVILANRIAQIRSPLKYQITKEDLFASSRIQSQPQLSTMARKVKSNYRWSSLVLPDEQMEQLKELASHFKNKNLVMDDWGFATKLSLGQGINALFSGPSGTGKTMAAEIIAAQFGLDLYKIDLSGVVNKYIGETEKNLNRVFTEAERSNAILFFDEADALLGKRSEVKDAHDRYANVEVAYLLQKMEEYNGITILATNLSQNIDEAFTRRIRFIVEFPMPSLKDRRRIWDGIWPANIPLATELDLDFMATQFKLSGGNIRNIALSAAFYAANNGQIVKMEHLVRATKREFQKIGRPCGKSEFGKYYGLLFN